MKSRNEWLRRAMLSLHDVFVQAGVTFDAQSLTVVCANKPRARGDESSELVFVSPRLRAADEVLSYLTSELVYISSKQSYRGAGSTEPPESKKLAKAIGLVGRGAKTRPSEELAHKLHGIADRLGPYPEPQVKHPPLPTQASRMIKIQCPQCEYKLRITQKWLEFGAPACPIHHVALAPNVTVKRS